ncbi:MAG TPA: hypothetical protein VLM75_05315 [Spirochaetota bacterium]|nr:hypothetical protein [Spirochaetota bacterium]
MFHEEKKKGFHVPLMARGDIDGLIGLFIDNPVNLLLINGLCMSPRMSAGLVFGRILPGTALSVIVTHFHTPGKTSGV